MKRYIAVLFVLLLGLTWGCAAQMTTQGRPIDQAKVSQIQVGKTTAEQLPGILGQPVRVAKSEGMERYYYTYSRQVPHWWMRDELNANTLEITVTNGIVTGYEFQKTQVSKLKE